MEYPNLAEVEQRSKRYWNVDGIPEIVMGGFWLLMGVAFVLQDLVPIDSWLAAAHSWAVMLVLMVFGLSANRIAKILKSKYTYPRSGYVEFREPSQSQRLLRFTVGGLAAAGFAVMIALSVKYRAIADISGPAFGVLMACGFLVASRQQGMGHFVWLSLISLLLGAALYPMKLAWMALSWFFIVMGVIFATVGIWRLRSFVRSIPLPGGNDL